MRLNKTLRHSQLAGYALSLLAYDQPLGLDLNTLDSEAELATMTSTAKTTLCEWLCRQLLMSGTSWSRLDQNWDSVLCKSIQKSNWLRWPLLQKISVGSVANGCVVNCWWAEYHDHAYIRTGLTYEAFRFRKRTGYDDMYQRNLRFRLFTSTLVDDCSVMLALASELGLVTSTLVNKLPFIYKRLRRRMQKNWASWSRLHQNSNKLRQSSSMKLQFATQFVDTYRIIGCSDHVWIRIQIGYRVHYRWNCNLQQISSTHVEELRFWSRVDQNSNWLRLLPLSMELQLAIEYVVARVWIEHNENICTRNRTGYIDIHRTNSKLWAMLPTSVD